MNNGFKSKLIWPGIIVGVIVLASALGLSAFAQHGGGEGKEGHGGDRGGGGHGGGGHGGQEGDKQKQRPGTVEQMCPQQGDMPPHYCEPSYKAMSSVRGIQVSAVAPAGDQEVMVTLRELSAMVPGVGQPIVIVAGAGNLAGAVIVNGGWKQTTAVHLRLQGTGSIYEQRSMHLHAFPLTGP
jgi:hypothetical protein